MDFKYLEKYKYPTSIVLNLTDNCNLACIYCFVQQQPHYMTLETAKQSIDFLVNNYNMKKEHGWLHNDEIKRITFFGGEPMLMFDQIIVPLMEYIENNYNIDEFHFDITTNGTLLNKERIEFMSKYNIIPLLSIDGNEKTQNYNRPCKNCKESSLDLISKNIPILLEYFPKTMFRSTVYKDSIQNLFEDYLYAEEMGFKNYTCIPDIRSQNWTEDDLNNYKNELFKIITYIFIHYLHNERPKTSFSNLEKAFSKIIFNDLNIDRKINTFNVARCGLGVSGVSINYQGDIFSCQEQDSREYGEYFNIGNLNNGIDANKHSKILKDYLFSKGGCEKEDNCKDCLLQINCSHGCPSTQKDIFNNISLMAYVQCEDYKFTLDMAIKMMNYLVQTNNTLFYEIMTQMLKIKGVIKDG